MSTQPEDLNALETVLAGMAPAPSRLDRDGLMFAAGRASAPRIWKAAACGLAGLSVILLLVFAFRPPQIIERTVVVTIPAPVPESRGASSSVDSEPLELTSLPDPDPGPSRNPMLEMRRQLLNLGDLPRTLVPATMLAAPPPARPLEKDLDLPPGSLRGLEPGQRSSFGPW